MQLGQRPTVPFGHWRGISVPGVVMIVGLAPLKSEMVADQTVLPEMNSANSNNSSIGPGKYLPVFVLKMLLVLNRSMTAGLFRR